MPKITESTYQDDLNKQKLRRINSRIDSLCNKYSVVLVDTNIIDLNDKSNYKFLTQDSPKDYNISALKCYSKFLRDFFGLLEKYPNLGSVCEVANEMNDLSKAVRNCYKYFGSKNEISCEDDRKAFSEVGPALKNIVNYFGLINDKITGSDISQVDDTYSCLSTLVREMCLNSKVLGERKARDMIVKGKNTDFNLVAKAIRFNLAGKDVALVSEDRDITNIYYNSKKSIESGFLGSEAARNCALYQTSIYYFDSYGMLRIRSYLEGSGYFEDDDTKRFVLKNSKLVEDTKRIVTLAS